MGDIIHALPALTDAQRVIPDISFDWVVEENFQEIPGWHPAVHTVIPVAIRRWRKQIWQCLTSGEFAQFRKQLQLQAYEYVIDAQGLLKSAILTKMARGVSCGFDKNSARESIAAVFYRQRFEVAKEQHAVTRIRELFAKALRYSMPTSLPNYGIDRSLFPKPEIVGNYLVFIHSTSRANKCWAEANWNNLAKLANDEGIPVYLPWGNQAELLRAERIASGCKQTIVLPKLSLSKMASLLANARGVITGDTGLGHLTAALDTPAVALYGPTNPKLAGTFGKNQLHLLNLEQLDAATVWNSFQSVLSSHSV